MQVEVLRVQEPAQAKPPSKMVAVSTMKRRRSDTAALAPPSMTSEPPQDSFGIPAAAGAAAAAAERSSINAFVIDHQLSSEAFVKKSQLMPPPAGDSGAMVRSSHPTTAVMMANVSSMMPMVHEAVDLSLESESDDECTIIATC